MIDPRELRKDFPMLRNNIKMQTKNLVFLDNASTTLKPDLVIDTINAYYQQETSNSHRGDYDLCFNVDTKIEKVREKVANFINADSKEIIFTSGATMSLNTIAYSYARKFLKKDDEILISVSEHASNVLPWFEVSKEIGCKISYIPLDKDGRITPNNVENAITENTKLISICHISNVLGYINDVKNIANVAHKHNIVVSIDGAQSVPHMKIDVKDLDIEFLSFSGHKMCGPTGIGVLYGKYELLQKMEPTFYGGGMNIKFNTNQETQYLDSPTKFESGTLNIEGIYGLGAAIDYINKIGIENIRIYEKNLRDYAISKLEKVPNIIIYNKNADSGIITFNIKNIFAQDEATYLNYKGIAVRSGQHCAKILHNFTNELATIRVSLYFYSTKEEIDYLVECLSKGGDFLDAYFN